MGELLRSDINFWIKTDMEHSEIGDRLQDSEITSAFEYDYENVYEWFEANLIDRNAKLNVSRAHHVGNIPSDEPLHFMLIGSSETTSAAELSEWTCDIARFVSKSLRQTIEIGKIEHVSGDDYVYHSSESIVPDGTDS